MAHAYTTLSATGIKESLQPVHVHIHFKSARTTSMAQVWTQVKNKA